MPASPRKRDSSVVSRSSSRSIFGRGGSVHGPFLGGMLDDPGRPSLLDFGNQSLDSQALTLAMWDQPKKITTKYSLNSKAFGAVVTNFVTKLSKLEENFGAALLDLSEGFKNSSSELKEGKSVLTAWKSVLNQTHARGLKVKKFSVQMKDAALKQIEMLEVDKMLNLPAKRLDEELTSKEKIVRARETDLEKATKAVMKMKDKSLERSKKAYKSAHKTVMPAANQKLFLEDEKKWKSELSDKEMAKVTKQADAKKALEEATEEYRLYMTAGFSAFQTNLLMRSEAVGVSIRKIAEKIERTSLDIYKSALTSMQVCRNLNKKKDLQLQLKQMSSGAPCPWLKQASQVENARKRSMSTSVSTSRREVKWGGGPKLPSSSVSSVSSASKLGRLNKKKMQAMTLKQKSSRQLLRNQSMFGTMGGKRTSVIQGRRGSLRAGSAGAAGAGSVSVAASASKEGGRGGLAPMAINPLTNQPNSLVSDKVAGVGATKKQEQEVAVAAAVAAAAAKKNEEEEVAKREKVVKEKKEADREAQRKKEEAKEKEQWKKKEEAVSLQQVEATLEEKGEEKEAEKEEGVVDSVKGVAFTDDNSAALDTTIPEYELRTPIVIDNGSSSIKAGFSGDSNPSLVVPSVFVSTRHPYKDEMTEEEKEVLVLDKAGNRRSHFSGAHTTHVGKSLIEYRDPKTGEPVLEQRDMDPSVYFNHQVFSDSPSSWEDLENLWESILDGLGASEAVIDHPVMLTQPTLAPLALSKRMKEIWYETFGVPCLYVATAPLLAAYAYGNSTGLVVDVGESSAQVVPLVDGYLLDAHVQRAKHLGGMKDTQRIIRYFEQRTVWSDPLERGKYPTPFHLSLMARGIKDRLSQTAASRTGFEDEMQVLTDAEGFLGGGDPDDEEEQKASGQLTVNPLSLQRELLSCGEVLFQPKELLNDRDSSIVSVPELIAQVCNACDVDTREQLLSNIFLSGGVTTMRGFDRRFEAELKELLPYAAPYINVFGSQRRYATWQGGSVLAALDEFKDSWEYRDDEDEDEGDEMEEES